MLFRSPSPPDSAPTATVVAAADAPAARFTREALIVAAWALVALVLALSYAARRLILSGRIGDRTAIVDGPLFEMLGQLARESRMRSTPRLTCTPRISSPIALGVREICVPGTALTALDTEQQRSMLAHELAHLARRDPVWMALASLVERVLWIQPLNRLARRRIAAAAEYICDDWAVGRTGSGVALARCLAQVAEWLQASPLGVPVAGMAEERSVLVARVARLLEGARPATRSRRVLAVGTLVVLLATVVFAPGVSGRSASEASVTGSSLWAAMVQRSAPPNSTLHDSTKLLDREDVSDLSRGWNVNRGLTNAGYAAVRGQALSTLSELRAPIPEAALAALLRDPVPDVRGKAAELAGERSVVGAVPALRRLLEDANGDVRQHAVEALGNMADAAAYEALRSALTSKDPKVRRAAVEALGERRQ